jgi:hypothetical protein
LTDASVQPTLSRPPLSERLDGHASLGLIDLVAWLALEHSTWMRSPFSPSSRLTDCLLNRLQGEGIILRIPLPEVARTQGAHRAIYEPLAWRLNVGEGERDRRCQMLLAAIRLAKREAGSACADALWLWEQLAEAELHSYLGHLLRRHDLDTSIATAVLDGTRTLLSLSCLAARRHIVWTAMRDGTTLEVDARAPSAQVVDRLIEVIQRLIRAHHRRLEMNASFVPSATWRRPLVLGVLLEDVTDLGMRYWTDVPQAQLVLDGLFRSTPKRHG